MMGSARGVDDSPGWINRRFHELEQMVKGLAAERRLPASTISEGDLTVEGGGSVLVKDGGDIAVSGGGDVTVIGGDVTVGQGGAVRVDDGGDIEMEGGSLNFRSNSSFITFYPDGVTPRTFFDSYQMQIASAGDPANTYCVLSGSSLTLYRAGQYNGIAFGLGNELAIQGTNGVSVTAISTGSAANCHLDLFGKIHVVVSSRRYKQDIEAIDVDPKQALKMQGRTWRDKREVKGDPKTAKRHVGFIAEELHDLGLTEFLAYDEQGRPDAIQYDRLSVALLAIIQDQEARMEDQENRLAALEARFAPPAPTSAAANASPPKK